MSSRRIFLKSIAPFAAAVTFPKISESRQVPEEDICRFHAEGLAQAMKAMHGGEWKVVLRHDIGSVYVLNATPQRPG